MVEGEGYRSTRQTPIVYRNELARALLWRKKDSWKCIATIWSFPRVKMPPGVKSSQP